jgi:hypothetical protein
MAAGSGQLRAGPAYRLSHAGLSRARRRALLGAFTLRLSPSRRGAGFAEKCPRMQPNGKLLFNIRISTEAEINGTVKGVV